MHRHCEPGGSQWPRIEPFLPGKVGDPGRSGADDRLFVNGVLRVLRSGAPRPGSFGVICPGVAAYGRRCTWKTVHGRFTRWARSGVGERIFGRLIGDPDNAPDNACIFLDSSLVRAHRQAATGKGAKGGPGCGALARRTDHENPYGGRCAWPAAAGVPDSGPAWGRPGRAGPAERPC